MLLLRGEVNFSGSEVMEGWSSGTSSFLLFINQRNARAYVAVTRLRNSVRMVGWRNRWHSTGEREGTTGQYRSDNFVIEYIEGAPCWVELVRGVPGPISRYGFTRIIERQRAGAGGGKAYIHYNTIKIPGAKHPAT